MNGLTVWVVVLGVVIMALGWAIGMTSGWLLAREPWWPWNWRAIIHPRLYLRWLTRGAPIIR